MTLNLKPESLHVKRNATKQEVKLIGGCGQGRRADRGDLLKVVQSQVAHFQAGVSHQYQASFVMTSFSLRQILEDDSGVGGMSVEAVGCVGEKKGGEGASEYEE